MARNPQPAQPELPNTKPKKPRKPKAPAVVQEAPVEAAEAAPAPVEKPKKARARKPANTPDVPAPWEYKFVAFGDLHVSAKTLDRCLDVLRRVGEMALANEAFIVCLGDFWHQRAALNVRQLDAVLTVFSEWKAAGLHVLMIPGNHDQVSLDGAVHAVRVFEPFDNVTLVTEPIVWEEQRIAFFPWRERDGEQDALFSQLEGDDWTVFTHAEIEGATTNHAHAAKGRVGLDRIEEKTRAVYAGHYHKRQQLGDRAWYVGSPFEMDFGERDMPHGVALITGETRVPEFVDFDDMPKHVKIDWTTDRAKLASIREQDIVEVEAPHDSMRSVEFSAAMASVKAADVRFVPKDERPEHESIAPAIALTLEGAVGAWADEACGDDARKALVVEKARAVLAEVADSRTIVPLAPCVRICQVDIENFCAIRGLVSWDVRNLGPVLLQGPMGVGKTSICDAITWGLFGTTTPRKASGGTLKADDVVHDAADAAEVHVTVGLAMPEGEQLVTIVRTKKRGKGAVIRISGLDVAEGIADQQALIHRIIGMDVDLWRACVYLGQGEVENFVVSADKKRKELLSRTFGLSACEGAVKTARAQAKEIVAKRQKATIEHASHQSAIAALAGTDFSAQARLWDEQMAAKRAGLESVVATEQARIAQIEPHLAAEAQWKASKDAYDAHLDQLTKALGTSSSEVQLQQAMGQLGGYTNEHAHTQKKLAEARAHYEHVTSKSAAPACFHCNQPIEPERHAIQAYEAEQAVRNLTQQEQHFAAHISNLNVKIGELRAGGDAGRTEIQSQITAAREHIEKCNTALATLAGMRETKSAAERAITTAQHEAMAMVSAANPFTAKAQETAERLAQHQGALAAAEASLAEAQNEEWIIDRVEEMFSPKGLPVLILRTVLYELETHANRYLTTLLAGKVHCRLTMREEDLDIEWFEWSAEKNAHVERSFLQLSGGQRRCAELAFSPFALSEMIFARCGVRIPFVVVDELTTHLDSDTKPIVCDLLRSIERETVIVIDHDIGVRGEFDVAIEVMQDGESTRIEKVEVAG